MNRPLLALALLALAPLAVRAQAVTWDSLGNPYTNALTALAFLHGPAPDGSADTLFASGGSGVWRYPPGGPFSPNLHPFQPAHDVTIVTATGALLSGAGDLVRSTDGGRTWATAIDINVTALYQTTLPSLGGAVLAGLSILFRSYADGAAGTWEEVGSAGGELAALAEVPPSMGLPAGRLLAGVWNGVAYSGNGGQTWTRSSLWAAGRYVVTSLAVHPDPAHPYRGVAYATARDFGAGGGRPGVWRSDDGGATWALLRTFEAGAFGLANPNWAVVAVGPDGVVWVGLSQVAAGPDAGTLARSLDGGQTWSEAAEGYGRWGVNALAFGRDGRLYAATDEGVWRTAAPVVSAEGGPGGDRSGVRLEVRPNPSSGDASFVLTLAEASASVRVALYDVLGRAVAIVHEGPLPPGTHRLAMEAAGLAPGVYVARAATDGGAVTARLVRAR